MFKDSNLFSPAATYYLKHGFNVDALPGTTEFMISGTQKEKDL